MQRLFQHTETDDHLNQWDIITDEGRIVAIFGRDGIGSQMYGAFVNGLAQGGRYSLYDEDAGQYVVGQLDQLVA